MENIVQMTKFYCEVGHSVTPWQNMNFNSFWNNKF